MQAIINKKKIYKKRQETVFLLLCGVFLGTLGIINILGISRFIDLSFYFFTIKIPMVVAVGVLPYPVTFLCTDLISELYGKDKAKQLVWIGFIVNLWIAFLLWLGAVLPGADNISETIGQIPRDPAGRQPLYFELKHLAFSAMTASMIAYVSAQFCDVYIFHFFKDLTKGKHLWLRNNASTIISQLVDTVIVILITYFYTKALPIDNQKPLLYQLLTYIFSAYIFKIIAALFDTIPFYILTKYLLKYTGLENKNYL